jgi:ubiquitin carboxyl-terminal hydrolase 10
MLMVVIYHHGTSATGGHYTADVLLQDGRTWLNLDDTKLKWVHAEDVSVPEKEVGNWGDIQDHHQPNGDEGWNNHKSKVAYILLYKRVHS